MAHDNPSAIEQLAFLGIETERADPVAVVALLSSPDRVCDVMTRMHLSENEHVHLAAMPLGAENRPEWAVAVPEAYVPMVMQHIRDALREKGYVGKAEVLQSVEARAANEY